MLVRWAALTDASDIYASEIRLFRTDYLSRGKVVEAVKHQGCLIGFVNSTMAGYVMFRMEGIDDGSIYQLVVLPRFRGCGYARELVTAATQQLATRGAKNVSAYTPLRYRVGVFVYKSCGFTDVDIVPDFYETGDTAVLMRKEL